MTDESQFRAAVEKLRRGDITGLTVLVEAYQIRALRAAFLITQDKPVAEDIVQSAFVRVYERIVQYDITRPFAPWFLRGVVNDALSWARKTSRHVSLDAERIISGEQVSHRRIDVQAARLPAFSQLKWRRTSIMMPSRRGLPSI